MAKLLTLDEIHIVLLAQAALKPQELLAIRRVTGRKSFDLKLIKAIQGALDAFPAMKTVSFTLNR